MFVIDKYKRITLTKGDTATMYVSVYDLDNKQYEIQDTDVITLTVRKTNSSSISLQKVADEDHYIVIKSSDTNKLDCGTYVYDVQLTTKDGYIYTIIPQNYFRLTQEVTF